jgi:hypothetical protein
VLSSRKIERATYDSVAFRFIAANDHPDHDTIATFRRRFLMQIEGLFVQVLSLAREMGVQCCRASCVNAAASSLSLADLAVMRSDFVQEGDQCERIRLFADAIVREAIDDEPGLLSRQNLFFWKATQSFPSLR